MGSINESRLFRHIFAIVITVAVAAVAYMLLPSVPVPPPSAGMYIPRVGGMWVTGEGYGTGEVATENLVQMSSALSSNNTLVIFGSSELQSTDLAQEPYNYLPNSQHIPVLAYGYSYMNTIGAYAVLAANYGSLSPKTKLVIMLSPTWFWHPAPSNYVLANLQPQVLIHLYNVPAARDVINGYFQLHKDEFTRVSPTQQAFTRKDDHVMLELAVKEHIYSMKVRLRSLLFKDESVPSYERPPYDYDPSPSGSQTEESKPLKQEPAQVQVIAQTKAASQANSNPQAKVASQANMALQAKVAPQATAIPQRQVNQQELANYQRRVAMDMAETENYLRLLPSENFDVNPEYLMLQNLVALLKARHVQALFVFQPINPEVYKNALAAHVLGEKIAGLMSSTGMQYFDMSDVSHYQTGTLRDGVHLGDPGWHDVDVRILQYMRGQ